MTFANPKLVEIHASLTNEAETGSDFLDEDILRTVQRQNALVLPWPTADNPGGFFSFSNAQEWRGFVLSYTLRPGIPEIVAAKFRRAQMLYYLAWVYFDLIKAGELVALTTLELALRDRYGNEVKDRNGNIYFSRLLKYMLKDGLTDEKIPMIRKYGGSAIGIVTGEVKPSLTEIRNSQAHGDAFDGLPIGGLLELVRDLIEFAYRDTVGRKR